MVDEVIQKFNARKDKLLALQQMEKESTYMTHVTEWLLRAQVFDREYMGKTIDQVSEIYVPKIKTSSNDSSFSLQA